MGAGNHQSQKMKTYYLVAAVPVEVDLLSLEQSLVHFLPSLVQVLSSLPVQHFIVHLSSLQLVLQVQALLLQPPSPAKAGCAINPVIPIKAAVKNIFFIELVLVFQR